MGKYSTARGAENERKEHADEKEENNDELDDEVPEFATIKKSESKTTVIQYVKSSLKEGDSTKVKRNESKTGTDLL